MGPLPHISASEARRIFASFFECRQHVLWPSSSIIPIDDPSILFINAGMNQFKSIFTGDIPSNSPLRKLQRVSTCQKCIRAGGKHNDLEDVGKDVYHHTFFEMLGNWSFGDYFKKETIKWSWELLTEVFKLPPDQLYVTFFGGDPNLPDCPPDYEARDIWLQYLPSQRILPFGAKDNFWEMAETGPCGPCSEIHFDRKGHRDAGHLVNKNDPSVLEIWNLVFTQYYRQDDRSLSRLPKPCVDTGMGLERLVSILQNKESNYDTDLFTPIFDAVQTLLPNCPKYEGKVGSDDVNKTDMALRVLADHIRCLTVAIGDGVQPSNLGRGYVVRRIMRRALRYGRQYLGAPKDGGWLHQLVDVVVSLLDPKYGYQNCVQQIKETIKLEEIKFCKTLDKGMERFSKISNRLIDQGLSAIPGDEAFTLYATFGFPIDLTQIMAEEKNLTVDVESFHTKFAEHQLVSDARQSSKLIQITLNAKQLHFLKTNNVPLTDDSLKYVWDTSGTGDTFMSKLVAIWDGEQFLNEACKGKHVAFLLNKTSFYAEQGGQTFDIGLICDEADESKFEVIDVQTCGGYILHVGTVEFGKFEVGCPVELAVDYHRRSTVANSHTATHSLNFYLREQLGSESEQRGSFVEPDRLRFDFSISTGLKTDVISTIQDQIRRDIQKGLPIYVEEMPFADSQKISGIRAVFGEIYPDTVRVVSIGRDLKLIQDTPDEMHGYEVSIELCGGTHVNNLKELKDFVFVSEEAIAKGVRRITALTGDLATAAFEKAEMFEKDVTVIVSQPFSDSNQATMVKKRLEITESKFLPFLKKRELLNSLDKRAKLYVEHGKAKSKERLLKAGELGQSFLNCYTSADPFVIINASSLCGDSKAVDRLAQTITKLCPSVNYLMFSANSSSVCAIAQLPKDSSRTTADFNAKVWLQQFLNELDGKCGGSDSRAVGSSKKTSSIASATLKASEFIKNLFTLNCEVVEL